MFYELFFADDAQNILFSSRIDALCWLSVLPFLDLRRSPQRLINTGVSRPPADIQAQPITGRNRTRTARGIQTVRPIYRNATALIRAGLCSNSGVPKTPRK